MKKPFVILVALLLVGMVGMVLISPVDAPAFRMFVDPSSITGLQPETPVIIRPDGDGYYKSWTRRTVVLRPNAVGTYSGWTGRTLTLNPSAEGTHREWSGWTHLQPRATEPDETVWETGWINDYRAWDDWPDSDVDDSYVATFLNNYNETSALTLVSDLPSERLGLTIKKVRVNIVAKKTAGDDQVQMMLCSVLNANVSSFNADSGWDGWSRTGSIPWLNREDHPTNYIYTSVSNGKIGNFTFDDVPSGIEWRHPEGVYVRLRTWQSVAGNDTIKIRVYDGATWTELIPFPPPATGTPLARQYREVDVSDFLNSVTKINNAQMRLEKITDSSGVADTIYVDYACIRVGGTRNPSSYGVPKSLTTSYAGYSSEWSTNPLTGLDWTWTDIAALQAGVRSVQVGASFEGYLRVTQLYVGIQTSQGIYKDWDDWPDPTGPNGGDEDYFTATANALRQSSALPDHTSSETWAISKVRVSIVARTNATTDEKVQLMLLPGPATAEANVDGFDGTYGSGWTKVGTTPWLGAADYVSTTVGNFIYQSASTGPASKMGDFSFANVPTGIPWGAVTLRIKTWTSGGVDGFDPMNIELYDGSTWSSTYPFTPTNITAPGNYVEVDVSSFLTTVEKINAAKMRITKGKLGTEDTIYIDHAYLLVSIVAYSLTTTYTEYTSEWSTNPATGLVWTWPDIDALEAGVKSVQSGAAWTGEIRVTQLYAKVVEAASYANWDDSPDHNSDIDYNSAISSGLDQSSGLENQPAGVTWTPGRVQVTIVAKTDITTDEKIRLMLVIAGAPANPYLAGYSQSLSTSYLTYSQAWDKNPGWKIGGVEQPWNWTAINDLQAGVRSVLGTAPWKGEIRVTQLYVAVGEAGTYDDWNDTTQDGDATYVSATMDGMRESSSLEDVTSPPAWPIARVRVVVVARTNVTTNEKVSLMLRIGGVLYAYPETGYELTTDYQMYTADWGLNPRYYTASPYTGPWNWTAINALEVGVTSMMGADLFWTGEIRITQLYVEIAGPRFTVDIKAENVISLNSFDFKLIYDTSVISPTGIIVGSLFDETVPYTEINDASGYVRVASVSEVVNFSGNTTLATIIFLVDSTGETILDLSIIKLIDLLGVDIHWILGDVDGDRTIDTSDLFSLSNAYGSASGDPKWNSKCDFNGDDKVDIYDLFDQSRNYGKTYSYDGYFSNI